MRFYEYEAKALFRKHGLPLGASEIVARAEGRGGEEVRKLRFWFELPRA